MIYYIPIIDNSYNHRDNYKLLYGDILNKIIDKEKNIDNVPFYNLYYLNREVKKKEKNKFVNNYFISFDKIKVSRKKINTELKKFLKKLYKKDYIKKGILEKYYCKKCNSYLDKSQVYKKEKSSYYNLLKIPVTKTVKPLSFYIDNVLKVVNTVAFGVKGTEYSNKKAILPILGKKIPVFQVKNIKKPDIYNDVYLLSKDLHLKEKDDFFESNYGNNQDKLIQDLKINGAYEQKIEKEKNQYYCKNCNRLVEKYLIESFYIDFNELDQKYHFNFKNFMLPLNQNKDISDESFTMNIYICSVCDNFTFKKEDICENCGNNFVKKKIYINMELLKYIFPLIIDTKIQYLLIKDEDISIFEDMKTIIEDIMDKEINVNKIKYLNINNNKNDFTDSFKKMNTILNVFSTKDISNKNSKKITTIKNFFQNWSKLFKGDLLYKLHDVELRTDFYIEKFITTIIQSLILDQIKAIENGDIVKYIDNLYNVIKKANEKIYPYLLKLNYKEDLYDFKASYYFYSKIILYISPFLESYDKYGENFSSYREDYYFKEDIEKDSFIEKFIDLVEKGKNILNIGNNKKIIMWLKSSNNLIMEKLNMNIKYIKKYLNIDEIKQFNEKEIPKKRLSLNMNDLEIFIPIYDLSKVRNLIDKYEKELEEIKSNIIKYKLKLLDFDFVNKAPDTILNNVKQKHDYHLKKKDTLKSNIKRLKNILKESDLKNEK